MNQPFPAGVARASASKSKMLARLRSDEMANQIRKRLREIGLRPTRTRVALGNILFGKGGRHVSAARPCSTSQLCCVGRSNAARRTSAHSWRFAVNGSRTLSRAPVISLLLVVQVPDASDVGSMAVLLRPLDCLALRLEGREDAVAVVLDYIVVDVL